MTVEGASIRVSATGPSNLEPRGEAGSSITIEGALDQTVHKDINRALLSVYCRPFAPDNPGAAIAANIIWNLVVDLPRDQFADLVALALSDRLRSVSIGVEGLRRGKGPIRSISFDTAPVPFEREDEQAATST
jgi:hypothetical protein